MATTEGKHTPQQSDNDVDDVYSSSDFVESNRYSELQNDIEEIYTNMQVFCLKEEFRRHVKTDGYDLENIDEKLRIWKEDVVKTECPIVIAGETSSGKSSMINLILGEKILPTGIGACTSRVCRVKYCEHYMVSTKDCENKELDTMSFQDSKEMAEQLKFLAKTDDKNISYVDIYMPVSLLQGNVIIVDTPGVGDLEQKEVADRMLSYLPNALAFVFVANVSNAGGLQDDRVLKKKPKYTTVFDNFQRLLKEKIASNENKRVKAHMRILDDFLDECNTVLLTKLHCARQNAADIQAKSYELLIKLVKLEDRREKEILDIGKNIDIFFDEVSKRLHEHIHHPNFKRAVRFYTCFATRFSINNALDICIEQETSAWLKENIEQIFQRTLMDELIKKFESIHRSLHSIKDNLKGLKSPFNVDQKFSRAAASSYRIISPNASLARTNLGFIFFPTEAKLPFFVAGTILSSTLAAANVIKKFEDVCENAFLAKIGIFTKENLKHSLKEKYSEAISNIIKQFLEGGLKTEINNIKENVLTMTDKRDLYTSEEETLTALLTTVTENIARLQELNTSVIYDKTV